MEEVLISCKGQLLGFVETLREANKIFLRNGRLMASIAFFTTFLYTILYLTNFLLLRPFFSDLLVKQGLLLATSPSSPEFANLVMAMQDALCLMSGIEWAFLLVYSAASVLFSAVTVVASALAHTGQLLDKESRPQDVALAAARCWRRPFLTFFYVSIFSVGYVILLLALMLPLLPRARGVAVAVSIFAALLCTHLSVVWTLGMVVSVLEDESGLGALGKAGTLLKGLQLKGSCLSLLINLLFIGTSHIWKLFAIGSIRSAYVQLLMGLVLVNGLWLITMYGFTGFTVLYYDCKRSHGEETKDMAVGFDYKKIPSNLPLITQSLP